MASVDTENQSPQGAAPKAAASQAGGLIVSRRVLIGLPLVALLLSLMIGSLFAWFSFGLEGLLVCLAVWAIVVVSSALGYLAGSFFASPDFAQAQVMVGMMVRTGIPLVFALIVTQVGQNWIDAGCIYYLFGFYFVGLAVDIFLVLATSPIVAGGANESVHAGR